MSEWQPIESYDALGLKPKNAVFYVKATEPIRPGASGLRPMLTLERRFGLRETTHWFALPPPPSL